MAAGNFTLFRANLDDIRMQDLVGATVKIALVTSSYTPDTTNTGNSLWADVSANEIAGGNGYTTGGATLGGAAVNAVTNGFAFDTNDATWNASGGNIPAWRYAVMYVSGTLWGKVNPLIGYFVGDNTPADIPATASGNPLTVAAPAAGWFSATQA